MWKEFYPDAIVIGLDVQDPLEIPNVICLKGDASDPEVLNRLFGDTQFDLIIDDGSHKTADQIATFKQLFYNNLREGGFYICEDVHTSNREEYITSEETMIAYIGKLDFANIKVKTTWFWKDPTDKTDSGTCLIRKR